jgi:hypothetical protein
MLAKTMPPIPVVLFYQPKLFRYPADSETNFTETTVSALIENTPVRECRIFAAIATCPLSSRQSVFRFFDGLGEK